MSGRHSLETHADRVKAAAAAVAVNVFLGLALITGLALRDERRREQMLETFDVTLPPPPPPPVVEEKPAEKAKSEPEGAQGKKSEPSPVVAPPSPVPRPTPVVAAPSPGTGNAPSSGNSNRGTGTGAGGSGSGSGGGGTGEGGGRIPAVLVSGGLTNRDYRAIIQGERSTGSAVVSLLVNTAGRVERCRTQISSGSARIDDHLCALLTQRLRFRPAREANGTPLYQDINYVARWRR